MYHCPIGSQDSLIIDISGKKQVMPYNFRDSNKVTKERYVSSHTQTCLDVPGVNLVGLRVVWLQQK